MKDAGVKSRKTPFSDSMALSGVGVQALPPFPSSTSDSLHFLTSVQQKHGAVCACASAHASNEAHTVAFYAAKANPKIAGNLELNAGASAKPGPGCRQGNLCLVQEPRTPKAFSPLSVLAAFAKHFKGTVPPKHNKASPRPKRVIRGDQSFHVEQNPAWWVVGLTSPWLHPDGGGLAPLLTAQGRADLPKLLEEVLLRPGQGVLIDVGGRPLGHEEVLHLAQRPAAHVAQPAAHGGRGAAHACVAVHVDRVSALQQRVQQAHGLRQHLHTAFSAHVRCWHPDVDQAFFLVELNHSVWCHGFWVAVTSRGILHNIPFCLEIHYSCNPQLVLQFDGYMFHLARAATQPDIW